MCKRVVFAGSIKAEPERDDENTRNQDVFKDQSINYLHQTIRKLHRTISFSNDILTFQSLLISYMTWACAL